MISNLHNVLKKSSSILGTKTPFFILKNNLKEVLDIYKSDFSPTIKSFNTLGSRRYFWEYFCGINFNEAIEWRYSKYYGKGSSSTNTSFLPKLKNLVSNKYLSNWQCDIQDITNVSCSKSNFNEFDNLYTLIQTNSPELIKDINDHGLQRNMEHRESKIFHNTNQVVTCELWSNIFTWNNEGGSHHFMAARYIAHKLMKPVHLTSVLDIAYIDKDKYQKLFSEYDIFLISNKNAGAINLLFEVLLNSKVTFLMSSISSLFSIDEDLNTLKLIAFYKSDTRSEEVVNIFNSSSAVNLEKYFARLIHQQEINEETNKKRFKEF